MAIGKKRVAAGRMERVGLVVVSRVHGPVAWGAASLGVTLRGGAIQAEGPLIVGPADALIVGEAGDRGAGPVDHRSRGALQHHHGLRSPIGDGGEIIPRIPVHHPETIGRIVPGSRKMGVDGGWLHPLDRLVIGGGRGCGKNQGGPAWGRGWFGHSARDRTSGRDGGALEHFHGKGNGGQIGRLPPVEIEVHDSAQVVLLRIGKDSGTPGMPLAGGISGGGLGPSGCGEKAIGPVILVERQADLPQVVGALQAVGRFPHPLNGGNHQAHENGDDGNDHQQLNESEGVAIVSHGLWPVCIPNCRGCFQGTLKGHAHQPGRSIVDRLQGPIVQIMRSKLRGFRAITTQR